MSAVLDKDRARRSLPHALVTKRDGPAMGQIPANFPVPFPAHEQGFRRRKTVVKDASGFVESRLASGCEAAWDLVVARARVAQSALGAVFKSH